MAIKSTSSSSRFRFRSKSSAKQQEKEVQNVPTMVTVEERGETEEARDEPGAIMRFFTGAFSEMTSLAEDIGTVIAYDEGEDETKCAEMNENTVQPETESTPQPDKKGSRFFGRKKSSKKEDAQGELKDTVQLDTVVETKDEAKSTPQPETVEAKDEAKSVPDKKGSRFFGRKKSSKKEDVQKGDGEVKNTDKPDTVVETKDEAKSTPQPETVEAKDEAKSVPDKKGSRFLGRKKASKTEDVQIDEEGPKDEEKNTEQSNAVAEAKDEEKSAKQPFLFGVFSAAFAAMASVVDDVGTIIGYDEDEAERKYAAKNTTTVQSDTVVETEDEATNTPQPETVAEAKDQVKSSAQPDVLSAAFAEMASMVDDVGTIIAYDEDEAEKEDADASKCTEENTNTVQSDTVVETKDEAKSCAKPDKKGSSFFSRKNASKTNDVQKDDDEPKDEEENTDTDQLDTVAEANDGENIAMQALLFAAFAGNASKTEEDDTIVTADLSNEVEGESKGAENNTEQHEDGVKIKEKWRPSSYADQTAAQANFGSNLAKLTGDEKSLLMLTKELEREERRLKRLEKDYNKADKHVINTKTRIAALYEKIKVEDLVNDYDEVEQYQRDFKDTVKSGYKSGKKHMKQLGNNFDYYNFISDSGDRVINFTSSIENAANDAIFPHGV